MVNSEYGVAPFPYSPLTTPNSRSSALQSLGGELVQIFLPVGRAIAAERHEVFPAVDAGRMLVVEHRTHGVIADGLELQDRDVALARNRLALGRRVPLHLGARAADAQILGAQVEALAVIERDGERPAVLVQLELRRPRLCDVVHPTVPFDHAPHAIVRMG